MSMTEQDMREVLRRVEHTFGFTFPKELEMGAGKALTVICGDGRMAVLAEDRAYLARGLFLLRGMLLRGERGTLSQERHFRSCGAFIDQSRGAVLTVEAAKAYIDYTAALGMNVFALYIEDTYMVPGYPYFGHYRGRFTQDELRELDRYCAGYDMELLPCIQTLAHLQQFLQWVPSRELSDTSSCLLAGEEKVYEFLEAAIASLRDCVSTRRLHIGMDEAHDVGLGRYLELHGMPDRFKLLTDHLDRVAKICEEHGFHPMMWSDMFFRLGSKDGDYYDPESHVPQRVIDSLPDVDMTYWDYYHEDEKLYEHMFTEHARMGRGMVFAGGNWTWGGFLPHVKQTEATMYPAMRVCVRHRVDTVLATMWGDDGNETDHFLALSGLAVFSEACYLGEAMTKEEVDRTAELLTGLPREVYEAFGEFFESQESHYTGKGLVYADLLYHLMPYEPDMAAAAERSDRAAETIGKLREREDCAFAELLFRLTGMKSRLIPAIRRAYDAGDTDELRRISEDELPRLDELYQELEKRHRALWEKHYKRQGWETMPLRYGAVRGRMADVKDALLRYASGELDRLEELEEEPLPATRRYSSVYFTPLVSPQARW